MVVVVKVLAKSRFCFESIVAKQTKGEEEEECALLCTQTHAVDNWGLPKWRLIAATDGKETLLFARERKRE